MTISNTVLLAGIGFAIVVGLVALYQARRPTENLVDGVHSWGTLMAQLADRDQKISALTARLERLQANYDRLLEDNKRLRLTVKALLNQLGETRVRVDNLNHDVKTMLERQPDPMTALRQTLVERFSEDELRTLAGDVGVPWTEIEGDTLPVKAASLIAWMTRRNKLDLLLAEVKRLRPEKPT